MTSPVSLASAHPRGRADLIHTLPVGLLVAAAFALAWLTNGSIDRQDWLPYAIAAALLLAIVLAAGVSVVPRRLLVGGVGGLALLAIWQAASLSWSPLPELARDDALLTAFYAMAALLAALTLRTQPQRLAASSLVAAACGIVAVAAAIRMRTGTDAALVFPRQRLAYPIDYENAQAAAFLVGFWPAIVVAARRTTALAIRTIALASAAACATGWLLTQSKGGGFGLAVSLVVVLAVAPERLRLVLPVALALAPGLVAYSPLTAPYRYDEAAGAAFTASVRHAGTVALVVIAVGAGPGFLYALADRQVDLPARTRRALSVIAAAAVIAGAVGGVAAFFVLEPHPVGFVQARWHSFKHYPTHETASSHLLSLGSNRYDFWRVALHEFVRHPLAGIGERGYQAAYLRERRSDETPVRSHSIELDFLSETGIVGFAAWLGAMGVLVAAAVLGTRRLEVGGVAALGSGVFFLAHASVDWIWTVPAVGLPVFLLLGAAAGPTHVASPLRPRVALPLAVVVFLIAALLLAPPWLSARLTAAGTTNASASDLRLAKRLDPLAVEPYVAEAAIAPTPKAAIAPLRQAVKKEPRAVGPWYELGIAELRIGHRAQARRALLSARELDPGDFLISKALARLRHRR